MPNNPQFSGVPAKKEREREERERRKATHGRGKAKGHERKKDEHIKDGGNDDMAGIDNSNENKRSGKDDNRKHQKQHKSYTDGLNVRKTELSILADIAVAAKNQNGYALFFLLECFK
ncbi:hypothetical protein SLEP1_g35805 [Rubroshorea leprosula]|uniref:Uncharacterized protein n=1 Tax=Rubroshorea leprosula TaxID=152421 RepID=A0AAV5KPQ0_9ROSI|nr:hypothetical protein SLEP1_g35805 [Rubroshorea leprosula]